jgi:uncharacterized protein
MNGLRRPPCEFGCGRGACEDVGEIGHPGGAIAPPDFQQADFELAHFELAHFEPVDVDPKRPRCLHQLPPNVGANSGYNMERMIPQDLLDMLVCPLCKEPVSLTENGTGLKCAKCRRVYPIQDDIPIMLVDAATIEIP